MALSSGSPSVATSFGFMAGHMKQLDLGGTGRLTRRIAATHFSLVHPHSWSGKQSWYLSLSSVWTAKVWQPRSARRCSCGESSKPMALRILPPSAHHSRAQDRLATYLLIGAIFHLAEQVW